VEEVCLSDPLSLFIFFVFLRLGGHNLRKAKKIKRERGAVGKAEVWINRN